MDDPLFDVLQPVRLFADVDQLTKRDRPSPEQPHRPFPAPHPVRPEALGFRAGAELAHDVTVRLQLHRLGILALHN